MPRGRRPKKGLSRMDAAVDAMAKFGFEKELVRKHVKELLGEYGGDEGWPFIEDCSYKELLEAILREQESDNLENVATDGVQIEEKSGGDEELVKPSKMVSEAENEPQSSGPLDIAEPVCPDPIHSATLVINNDGNGWIDNDPNDKVENHVSANDQELPRLEDYPSITTETPALLPRKEHSRRCLHFYGWIDRYEEDIDDFITLRPSSMVLGPIGMPRKRWNCETRKRRSRWDERPDDP